MDPIVSVIVPTFNSEKYLHRCLRSMEMQTYKNIEIIIVDAGSSDNTFNIAQKYQGILAIQFLVLKKSNQSEARNLGLKHATGKYISFCDSDDFYLPEKIEKQVAAMENMPIDVSYFDAFHFYSDQPDQFFLNSHSSHPDILVECIANQTINLNTVMVRKEYLDVNKITFPSGDLGRYGEDGNFIFQLALNHGRFQKLQENLSVVEVRKDSHTQWELQAKMKQCAIQYLTEAKTRLSKYYQDLINKSIKRYKFKLFIASLIANRNDSSQFRKMINFIITFFWDLRRRKAQHNYINMDIKVKNIIKGLLNEECII